MFDLGDTFCDAVKCPANSDETRRKHYGMNMSDQVKALDLREVADAGARSRFPDAEQASLPVENSSQELGATSLVRIVVLGRSFS